MRKGGVLTTPTVIRTVLAWKRNVFEDLKITMAAFSLAVYFLLLHGTLLLLSRLSIKISIIHCTNSFYAVTGFFGELYIVTVITDPPSGLFMTGNWIDFTCHVYPLPPEPITYSWHAMINGYSPTTLSGQNTTQYTPSYRDLHFSWFFCKVFSNESLISVGRRLLEIHGKKIIQLVIIGTQYHACL